MKTIEILNGCRKTKVSVNDGSTRDIRNAMQVVLDQLTGDRDTRLTVLAELLGNVIAKQPNAIHANEPDTLTDYLSSQPSQPGQTPNGFGHPSSMNNQGYTPYPGQPFHLQPGQPFTPTAQHFKPHPVGEPMQMGPIVNPSFNPYTTHQPQGNGQFNEPRPHNPSAVNWSDQEGYTRIRNVPPYTLKLDVNMNTFLVERDDRIKVKAYLGYPDSTELSDLELGEALVEAIMASPEKGLVITTTDRLMSKQTDYIRNDHGTLRYANGEVSDFSRRPVGLSSMIQVMYSRIMQGKGYPA